MSAVLGACFHGTRSGHPNNPTEGTGTVGYCLTPGTTSYNFIIDWDGTIYELVPPGTAAWHAEELNYTFLGVAFAQGVESDPITREQHASARWLVTKLSGEHHFPLRRIPGTLAGPWADKGLTQHMDTAQGRRWGKSDVGPNLDWSLILP